MVTTNSTRHENKTKIFDELLLCIQIIKPLRDICHKVMLHPEGLLKISSFPWFPIERLHDWIKIHFVNEILRSASHSITESKHNDNRAA